MRNKKNTVIWGHKMFEFIECPSSDLPPDQELLNLLSEENVLPNQAKREFFLCHLRLMCLAYLKREVTGSPSSLLQSQIEPAFVHTSAPEALKSKLESILFILRYIEFESSSFFEDPEALLKMQRCYVDLKNLLAEIQDNMPKYVEVFYYEFGSKKSFPLKFIEGIFSKDAQTFFEAFVYTFTEFCNSLSSQDYFKKTAWENRQDHLDENSLTEKICSYLEPMLCTYNVKIISQKQCDDGICDIMIQTPSNEIIPIEAKNSDHSELWNAIESQLVAKYMRSNQYGIYLVYWYGSDRLTRSSLVSSPPSSHEELESSLIEYSIPETHKKRVKVFCINCN